MTVFDSYFLIVFLTLEDHYQVQTSGTKPKKLLANIFLDILEFVY